MPDRFFFRLGAVIWIAGGIGHLVLVDALTLHGRTGASRFTPHTDILGTMERTTLTFGYLGSTTAFLAAAGFSIWVALSLALLGLTYLLVSRQEGVKLRPFTHLGLFVSTAFTAIAAMSFIYPATIGGLLAIVLFGISRIKNEN